jgi:hypothetical protein
MLRYVKNFLNIYGLVNNSGFIMIYCSHVEISLKV